MASIRLTDGYIQNVCACVLVLFGDISLPNDCVVRPETFPQVEAAMWLLSEDIIERAPGMAVDWFRFTQLGREAVLALPAPSEVAA